VARAPKLTHLNRAGDARMVDVSTKAATEREAVAEGRIAMAAKTLDVVLAGNAKKGDVLGTARIAGIMAGEANARTDPALSSPFPLEYCPRHRARTQSEQPACAGAGQGHRPAREWRWRH
jgi:molybdenum cofactor biosynthesis enzyme